MSEYAWAAGWGVADGSLVAIEDDLASYMGSGPTAVPFAIRSQPPRRFPVRERLGSGRIRGDGFADQLTLTIPVLTRAAMERIQDEFFSGGTVVSAKVTVRLFVHDLNEFRRFNAWFELYNPDDDGEHQLGEFRNVQLRFHDLQAL